MNIYPQIKETSAFKSLEKVKQNIVLRKQNVHKISHGIELSKNLGFDKWLTISSPSKANQSIVKELLNL